MIRRAVLQDIPALMDIYNEAILHTTATFDTEVKDMENRKAWFAEHNGRYVIYVDGGRQGGGICVAFPLQGPQGI